MTKNMGHLDRTFRFVAALLVAILYVTGLISGTVALVLGVVS
ncbi:MAG: YgaP-like transmembrane domain, partial [Bacteroidota bacterium]